MLNLLQRERIMKEIWSAMVWLTCAMLAPAHVTPAGAAAKATDHPSSVSRQSRLLADPAVRWAGGGYAHRALGMPGFDHARSAQALSPENRHAVLRGPWTGTLVAPGTSGSPREPRATSAAGVWVEVFPPPGRANHSAVLDPVRNRMIVFGGWYGGPTNEVWAFSLSGAGAWSRIHPSGDPPTARYAHSAVYDPVRDRVVVFGGIDIGWPTNDAWELSLAGTPAWRRLTPSGTAPEGRAFHVAIYDSARDRMIVFGGYHPYGFRNDVWSLSFGSGSAWSAINPSGVPPAGREGADAILDPVRDRMLVFGGYGSGTSREEVWSLTLAGAPAWAPLAPAGTPPPGSVGYGSIYDPVGDRMLTFGGSDGNFSAWDTRVWQLSLTDGMAWSVVSASETTPTARGGHTAVYDPLRRRMVLFGGGNDFTARNDVWSLGLTDSATWEVLSPPGGGPGGRRRPTVVLDSNRERMIVFGGSYLITSEVWTLGLEGEPAWGEIHSSGPAPTGRSGHTAIYDPVQERMIVFGGEAAGYLDDLWALELSDSPAWQELQPAGPLPTARYYHTAIHDPLRNRMLMYGGTDGSGYYGDLWELSLTGAAAWKPVETFGTIPVGRAGHTAVYDPRFDRMLVFGGWDGTKYDDEVWALSLAGEPTWALLVVDGDPPSGRSVHTAVLDAMRNEMLVFAGFDSIGFANGGFLDELWALSLAGRPSWRQLSPGNAPPRGRGSHAALLDPGRNRMITFAGHDDDEVFNDVWWFNLDAPVSVVVALASTEVGADRVRLAWSGAGAQGMAAWVERRTENTEWQPLSRITSDGAGWLRYEDSQVSPGARYAYRLLYYADGERRTTAAEWVEIPAAILALHGFRPNPAIGRLLVSFSLVSNAEATLEVFDISGRRAAAWPVGNLGAGPHRLEIPSLQRLRPGVYTLRLTQAGRSSTTRGLVLR